MVNYNAIIFDLGDVQFSTNWTLMNETLDEKIGVPIFPKKGGRYDFYVDLQKGLITSSEYFQHLLQAAGKNLPINLVETTYKEAYQNSTIINNEVILLTKDLKKKLTIIGASTTNSIHEDANKTRNLFDNFDQIYLSYKLKLIGEQFIRKVITLCGFQTDQMIYVDNSQTLCEIAQKIGLTPIVFTNSDKLKSELKNLGVL
jgi:FMN phosphatase YigB (HAD superfamily)